MLELRAAGHSVTEIAAALTSEGMPVSAQTAWQILDAEGIPRLPRGDGGRRGPPAKLDPGDQHSHPTDAIRADLACLAARKDDLERRHTYAGPHCAGSLT